MGLFEKKKKDAERCPICGKEISFFSGLVIADGRICDDCEKMVRGQFNIEEYYGRENWKIWNVKKAGKGQNKPGLLLCASGLYTLHDVLQKNDWNEHEIENRAEWLLANAQNIWKI